MRPRFSKALKDSERVISCEVHSHSIVIGKAFILGTDIAEPKLSSIPPDKISFEVEKYLAAIESLKTKYYALIDQAQIFPIEIRDEMTDMLNAELLMLSDPGSSNKICAAIHNGLSSLRATYNHYYAYSVSLKNSDNSKIQATAGIIDNVMRAIIEELSPTNMRAQLKDVSDNQIPVVPSLPVGKMYGFKNTSGVTRIHGMINTEGSEQDHTNIIARSIGVTVVRVNGAERDSILHGQRLIIDGPGERLILSPKSETLRKYQALNSSLEKNNRSFLKRAQKEKSFAMTLNRKSIQVLSNISFSDDVAEVNLTNADGIGLYRTEMVVQNRSTSVSEDRWYEIFAEVVRNTKKNHVVIRTIDLQKDKINPLIQLELESSIVKKQLAAAVRIAHESLTNKVQVMIPAIKSDKHLKKYQDLVNEQAAKLLLPTIKLGAMVEEVEFLDSIYSSSAAFLSIGTNDLIAKLLKMDRYCKGYKDQYDPTDPIVLNTLKKISLIGVQKNCPVSLCGDMASDPKYFSLLIGSGIRSFSIGSNLVPTIKELARRIDTNHAASMVENLIDLDTKVERLALLDWYNNKYLGLIKGRNIKPCWNKRSANSFTINKKKLK